MSQEKGFLRFASPNERRTITREDLGHYHAVIIAAIYAIPNLTSISELLHAALQECIATHPFLSVVVKDKHTEKPYYQRVSEIKLTEHVETSDVLMAPGLLNRFPDPTECADIVSREMMKHIEGLFRRGLDRPFREGIPPWRVVIVTLPSVSTTSPSSSRHRYFIAFEYSHAIGDGPSGIAFHRTLFSALKKSVFYYKANPSSDLAPQLLEEAVGPTTNQTGMIVKPCEKLFPQAFDTPERLRISWGFLLAPLLGAILPSFVGNLLGLKAQASSTNEGTWTGTPCFFDPKYGAQSKVVLVSIPSEDVNNVIREARKHGAKLTGVIHCLVVRALGRALRSYRDKNDGKGKGMVWEMTNFVGTTAINMRGAVGVPESEMGEFASGVYTTFRVPPLEVVMDEEMRSNGLSDQEWEAARAATLQFADAATRLQDQPIGLLRYVPSIRKWIQGKLGKTRDASYEVSNLGYVDFGHANVTPGGEGEDEVVEVENMFFAQPGHVTSHTINFNIVSTKMGGMVVCITWPTGSLGLEGSEKEEEKFVRGVGDDLAKWFKAF
ncbi:alcohol acetyltransferase [Rhypophila decipiens]|uniref:Alcohol acetyltransferase n=1 Tax=Rhypophila decipiens TaxID=261697 RepID=A0AAN7B2T4_9PEZI|nr:alcohol acetyltransferase [Rhypophila decipiens]